MDIPTLIEAIGQMPDCEVRPPVGVPFVAHPHRLPADLELFYQLCGGVYLFSEEEYPLDIVPAERMVVANPVIFSYLSDEDLDETKGHASWSWYIIGKDANSEYITIDLGPERLGYCYDSFWDRHPGNSTIIATSFTTFLGQIVAARGEEPYWTHPDFVSLGDAFDS